MGEECVQAREDVVTVRHRGEAVALRDRIYQYELPFFCGLLTEPLCLSVDQEFEKPRVSDHNT